MIEPVPAQAGSTPDAFCVFTPKRMAEGLRQRTERIPDALARVLAHRAASP